VRGGEGKRNECAVGRRAAAVGRRLSVLQWGRMGE